MLPLLPELWLQIIDHLGDEPETLKSISLTKKAFYPQTRKRLFKRVVLSRNAEYATQVLDCVANTQHLCEHIQEIVIKGESIGPKGTAQAAGKSEKEALPRFSIIDDLSHPYFRTILLAYQKKLTLILEKTNQTLNKIHWEMNFKCFPQEIETHLIAKQLQVIQSSLITVDLPFVKNFDISSARPGFFGGLLGDTSISIDPEYSPWTYSNATELDESTFIKNLDRVSVLRYRQLDSAGFTQPNSAGEFRMVNVESVRRVLFEVHQKMPNLQVIDLRAATDHPLELTVLGQLPLTSLSLSDMIVSDLTSVFKGTMSTMKNISLSSVAVNLYQEEDRWHLIFATLGKLALKSVALWHLDYKVPNSEADPGPIAQLNVNARHVVASRILSNAYPGDDEALCLLLKSLQSNACSLQTSDPEA